MVVNQYQLRDSFYKVFTFFYTIIGHEISQCYIIDENNNDEN